MEGSKKITIEILQNDIMKGVKSNSYYVGEARKDQQGMLETASRLQASDDNDDILIKFIKSAASKLCNLLTKTMGDSSYVLTSADPLKFIFTSNAVANFMDSQKGALTVLIQDYIENTCLMDWMATNKPDEAKWFFDKITSISNEIRIISSHRSKPSLS